MTFQIPLGERSGGRCLQRCRREGGFVVRGRPTVPPSISLNLHLAKLYPSSFRADCLRLGRALPVFCAPSSGCIRLSNKRKFVTVFGVQNAVLPARSDKMTGTATGSKSFGARAESSAPWQLNGSQRRIEDAILRYASRAPRMAMEYARMFSGSAIPGTPVSPM